MLTHQLAGLANLAQKYESHTKSERSELNNHRVLIDSINFAQDISLLQHV